MEEKKEEIKNLTIDELRSIDTDKLERYEKLRKYHEYIKLCRDKERKELQKIRNRDWQRAYRRRKKEL